MNAIEAVDALGLALLSYRLWPRPQEADFTPDHWPRVSIIVPARNEEKVIERLLQSLLDLDYPNYEIILANDNSTDSTAAIASSFPVRLLEVPEKPELWQGKTWACHKASLIATGEYYLFTDADTRHEKDSLKRSVGDMLRTESQGLSALPYHQNPEFWEQLLGPFQSLLISLTHPHGNPKLGKVFAIGQYLMFEKLFYEKIGGHEKIKYENVDDLSLANLVLEKKGRWKVYHGARLFEVRMYENLKEFFAGWRRSFRGGFKYSGPMTGIEMTLYIMAISAFRNPSVITLSITILSLCVLFLAQRKIGNHSVLGVLLAPWSLLLFSAISACALYDKIFKRPLIWKNRSYDQAQSQRTQ